MKIDPALFKNSIYFPQDHVNKQMNVTEKLFLPHGGVLKESDGVPASVNLLSVTSTQIVQCLHKPVSSRFTLVH